jgi:glutamate synthase (NADPH/NADH) small chain
MTEETRKKLDLERKPMPKQAVEVRRQNFYEVALGYTPELAMAEAQRCLNCKKPACVLKCRLKLISPALFNASPKAILRKA